VTSVSGNLSDRGRLRDDLAGADADVFLVELKAAAVDVVAEEAARRGVRIVIASNDVVPLPGEPSLDVELDRLASETLSFASEAVQ
jgi:cyclic 2,3-diphosphoglycerate synthetase